MGTFTQCPKKYFYEYVLKLTPEPTYPAYGTLGSKAHTVIEDFYKYVTIPCDPTEEFDDLIGRLYAHEFSDIIDYKGNMLGGLLNFLKMEVLRYDNLEDKDLFIPKYSELYLKSDIGGVPFSGRIDSIYEEPDGHLCAVDYKFTNKNSIGAEQKQQSCIYAILLKNELGIEFNEFTFWFLRHGPDKKRSIKKVKIDDKLIDFVNKKVYKQWDLINSMDFPRRQSWLCRYCGYVGICCEERSGI